MCIGVDTKQNLILQVWVKHVDCWEWELLGHKDVPVSGQFWFAHSIWLKFFLHTCNIWLVSTKSCVEERKLHTEFFYTLYAFCPLEATTETKKDTTGHFTAVQSRIHACGRPQETTTLQPHPRPQPPLRFFWNTSSFALSCWKSTQPYQHLRDSHGFNYMCKITNCERETLMSGSSDMPCMQATIAKVCQVVHTHWGLRYLCRDMSAISTRKMQEKEQFSTSQLTHAHILSRCVSLSSGFAVFSKTCAVCLRKQRAWVRVRKFGGPPECFYLETFFCLVGHWTVICNLFLVYFGQDSFKETTKMKLTHQPSSHRNYFEAGDLGGGSEECKIAKIIIIIIINRNYFPNRRNVPTVKQNLQCNNVEESAVRNISSF